MISVKQSSLFSLLIACLMLSAACSSFSSKSGGIPEIQGVWRYSEGKLPHAEPSLTFEFQRDQFRVSGHPDVYARGRYTFTPSASGGYELVLLPEDSHEFTLKTIKVQPTGGRLLLIDRMTYRRILRQ